MSEFGKTRITPKTSRHYNFISASLALLLWGSWAFWINSLSTTEVGRTSPLISAVTQGIGSFIITLIMVRAVTFLYGHVPPSTQLVLPALLTVAATGTCLAMAHALVGTRDIVRTISPALIVAFLFNVYTAYKLRQATGCPVENCWLEHTDERTW